MKIYNYQIKKWILSAGLGSLVAILAPEAGAQANITQNNLIPNGGFDSGSAGWSNDGGGIYFYNTTVGTETDSICSFGWWNGASYWQNTGATVQPGLDYVMTIRALVGSSPLTGVNLSFQDVTAGWTVLTNENFNFPDQTLTWRIFSMYISSNTISGAVGDTIGVGGAIVENPTTQYGWLWTDWIQLAPAIPQFTMQPQSVTNYAGSSVSLSVATVGAVTNSTGSGSAITYQWYESPANLLVNATNPTLSFLSLSNANSGSYYVVATGPYGSSQSSNAIVDVLPASSPIVATPPQSQTAYIHQTVEFSVVPAGSPPFSYQWESNSIAIAGATNSVLILNSISAASAGTYSVGITNVFGGISTNVLLTVITPNPGTYEAAAIDLQPKVYLRYSDISSSSNIFNEGTLGSVADGNAEGGYLATIGPDASTGYPNFETGNPAVQYDGASGDTVIPPLNFSTNEGNTITMTGWIYCYGQEMPYSGILFERDSGSSGLQVQNDANGNNILSYDWATGGRWQFTNGPIIPQYKWCFTALVVTPTNATIYLQDGTSMKTAVDTVAEGLCNFSNNTYVGWDPSGGTAGRRFNGIIDETTIFNRSLSPTEVYGLYSAAVGAPPSIVTSPASVTNYSGKSLALTVVASGAPPLSFQWFKDNNSITNATNDTYSVTSATTSDSGNYYVKIQNTAGFTNSEVATVAIVNQAPFFTAEPQPVAAWAGLPTSLTGTADGSLPLTYQWFKNNTAMTGETNATLYFTDPQAGDEANYSLQVINNYGQTNSAAVALTLLNPSQTAQALFWTWTNSPPDGPWLATVVGNTTGIGGPYDLTGAFPYLQGDQYNDIYQQITGTIPAGSAVNIALRIANFNQSWSVSGTVTYGFYTVAPTTNSASYNANAAPNGSVYEYASPVTTIPVNFSTANLADGLGNTGGNVDYSYTFFTTTTTNLTNPYFVVRKEDGNNSRYAVDNITISYSYTPPTINSFKANAGTASISFAGIPGSSYNVQVSTNLINWTTLLTTNAPANGLFQFNDSNAAKPTAFYRLMWNGY